MKNKETKYIAVDQIDYYSCNIIAIILVLFIIFLISIDIFQLHRNETLENRNKELESNYSYLLDDYNSMQKLLEEE